MVIFIENPLYLFLDTFSVGTPDIRVLHRGVRRGHEQDAISCELRVRAVPQQLRVLRKPLSCVACFISRIFLINK